MHRQRQFVRWPICQPVKLKITGSQEERECKSRDLGPRGMGLDSPRELSSDAAIKLDIGLSDQGRIAATGKVVWQKKLDNLSGRYIAGIKFINITSANNEKIFQYAFSNCRDAVVKSWWQGLTR